MKKIALSICLIVLLSGNLFSQSNTLESNSGYINVDGGKLYYETAGEGDYIVLIHDGILHHVIWDAQFYELAKNYKVVRYDRRGFGKSDQPKAPFSHTDDLDQLFKQLNIDNAVLFGMSAGGGLAINFTLKYPERVNTLVLVGAVVSGYGYSKHFLSRGGNIQSLLDVLEPEKFIPYFGWDDPYEIYPENIEAKKKFLKWLEANPQNVTGALGYFSKPPERAAVNFLSEIKVPALILVGEFDIPDVHAHSGAIETGIANSRREIIYDAGHLIPLEQPAAFNASVMKFLNGIEFFNLLSLGDVDGAVKNFHKVLETDLDAVLFEEAEVNAIGYGYLQNGKIKEAIQLFKLNTIAYPNSGNVFDSLGEAYLKDGQIELAIENYEKALELNPDNSNAQQVLQELKEKK